MELGATTAFVQIRNILETSAAPTANVLTITVSAVFAVMVHVPVDVRHATALIQAKRLVFVARLHRALIRRMHVKTVGRQVAATLGSVTEPVLVLPMLTVRFAKLVRA